MRIHKCLRYTADGSINLSPVFSQQMHTGNKSSRKVPPKNPQAFPFTIGQNKSHMAKRTQTTIFPLLRAKGNSPSVPELDKQHRFFLRCYNTKFLLFFPATELYS